MYHEILPKHGGKLLLDAIPKEDIFTIRIGRTRKSQYTERNYAQLDKGEVLELIEALQRAVAQKDEFDRLPE